MKIVSFILLSSLSSTLMAADFSAQLADEAWDGKMIPKGQQCQKFKGEQPATPALKISGIPAGTNMLEMAYSDRDYEPMNNGGHGRVGMALNHAHDSIDVPAIAGHSFDLPTGFLSIEAHRNPKWDKAGTYMPPCSGGKGHAYYVTVKALQFDGNSAKTLAETLVEIGKY